MACAKSTPSTGNDDDDDDVVCSLLTAIYEFGLRPPHVHVRHVKSHLASGLAERHFINAVCACVGRFS